MTNQTMFLHFIIFQEQYSLVAKQINLYLFIMSYSELNIDVKNVERIKEIQTWTKQITKLRMRNYWKAELLLG